MVLASFKDFSFTYPLCSDKALSGIDLSISEGEFWVLCGASASGKTTLIKNLKQEITPEGIKSGGLCLSLAPEDVAIVFQNPETGLVLGNVLNDLVFHMENLGFSNDEMKKQLAETVSFFGIEHLLHKEVSTLSGGQKQLISLCAALMTKPRLLLLDEPVSQLDPIAAKSFLEILKRLNEEFSITIVMTEHRLDDVFALCNRTALLDKGKLVCAGTPEKVVKTLWEKGEHTLFIPPIPRVCLCLMPTKKICFSPRELKEILPPFKNPKPKIQALWKDICVKGTNLLFSYRKGEFILKNLSLTIYEGELLCLVGGNGSGKSTLLKIFSKIISPYSGSLKQKAKKIAYLPQNPYAYFYTDKVSTELAFDESQRDYYEKIINELQLKPILERHPYNLSGGEAQKASLASILLRKPDLILLDEPTKGLDPYSKEAVSTLLKQSGATVIIATHDLEFAAQNATRCAMLFDGDIAFLDTPENFLGGNRYYTTQINKAVKHIAPLAVNFEDVMEPCTHKTDSSI